MLKLVEIINTMPKRVCRVVLFAESKDDINQKALEEFQSKAGFTVIGIGVIPFSQFCTVLKCTPNSLAKAV